MLGSNPTVPATGANSRAPHPASPTYPFNVMTRTGVFKGYTSIIELSKKRAASVTDALMKAKLPNAEFDLAAVGDAGAVTSDGKTAPLRRRADVVLKLSQPKG